MGSEDLGSEDMGSEDLGSLEELEVLANSLLKQAQELPPSSDRNEALKDIGKMRQRLAVLKRLHKRDLPQGQSK